MRPLRCAVASPHVLATATASASIRRGGNAIDAAIGAALALSVVYPHNTSLGGDLIALVRDVDGSIACLNASGPASRHADLATYRGRYGERMPVTGIDTVTVPGAVAGLGALHDRGAALSWRDHFVDPLDYAARGVRVARSVAEALEENLTLIADDAGLSSVYVSGGRTLREGDVLRQPALALTLTALARDGHRSFYEGAVSERLVRGLAALGSTIDRDDLAAYRPTWETPLRGSFRHWDVWTSGPNSQGFNLLQILGALHFLAADCEPLGADAGVLTELFRAATADRGRALADPSWVGDQVSALLAPEYLSRLAAGARRGGEGAPPSSEPVARPRGDTVAIVTADDDGRAVCLIQSLFHSFGSGILEPSTGVVLHNRGSSFALSSASLNVLAGGKRPAHTLMPVMVTTGGELSWVVGTMGGRAQPQILTQVLLRLFDGASPVRALGAPRWIVGDPDVDQANEVAWVEAPITPDVRSAVGPIMSLVEIARHDERTGHAQVVARSGDGALSAASDPRSDGRGVVTASDAATSRGSSADE